MAIFVKQTHSIPPKLIVMGFCGQKVYYIISLGWGGSVRNPIGSELVI